MEQSSPSTKGNSLNQIYRGLSAWELHHLPSIKPSRYHTVLFELPITSCSTDCPKPYRTDLKWDSMHVRMPYATQSEMIIANEVNI